MAGSRLCAGPGGPGGGAGRGGQARRRSGARARDHAVRRGAGAQRRRHGDRRRGRAAARAGAAHRQHEDRAAELGRAAGRRGVHDSRSACSSTASSGCRCCRSASCCGASPRCSSAFAGSYSSLLLTRLAARRRDRDRRPGDRLADRRLLPRARARPRLRLHPRRRDRRHRRRLHHQRHGGQPDRPGGRRSCCSAIPGFFLARELYRTVPEPLRGGQSRLEPA